MPENLRKIMDEYVAWLCLRSLCSRTQSLAQRFAEERRRAEEDAKQSGVWGILNSSTGALMGATCAGSILWLLLFQNKALLVLVPVKGFAGFSLI